MLKDDGLNAGEVVNRCDVMLLERQSLHGSVSLPLTPGAIGYLTETPDGYMFVSLPRPEWRPHKMQNKPEWSTELEESCF
jgi:hypothetical protein